MTDTFTYLLSENNRLILLLFILLCHDEAMSFSVALPSLVSKVINS